MTDCTAENSLGTIVYEASLFLLFLISTTHSHTLQEGLAHWHAEKRTLLPMAAPFHKGSADTLYNLLWRQGLLVRLEHGAEASDTWYVMALILHFSLDSYMLPYCLFFFPKYHFPICVADGGGERSLHIAILVNFTEATGLRRKLNAGSLVWSRKAALGPYDTAMITYSIHLFLLLIATAVVAIPA